jgi:hypothetical protein
MDAMVDFICVTDNKPCNNIAITATQPTPCRGCPRKLGVTLGKVFIVEKGNRHAKWKIIQHPYFDNGFAVISDYPYLNSGVDLYGIGRDIDHIASGAATLEMACKQAYDMT